MLDQFLALERQHWLLPLQVPHGTPEFTEDGRVELSFETSEVRAVCIGREAAVGALGDAAAKDLAARLSEAEASANFDDLKLLLDAQLELCADGTYRLALSTGWVVCGRPGGVTVPKTSTDAVDWENVTRMRIVSIEPLA